MRFVTDFLWRSPLGLRINAQDTAGVSQTEDWVKIRGDQLVPRDGSYDVRITAELWETHFVDHVSLMVGRSSGRHLEVFVDERFAQESPALPGARDDDAAACRAACGRGGPRRDRAGARQDGRYLATFARGAYQGVAGITSSRSIWARDSARTVCGSWPTAGSIPTDSSINVAIGQGRQVQPRGLSLEAQDDAGRWVVVAPDLGFPGGKNKTI